MAGVTGGAPIFAVILVAFYAVVLTGVIGVGTTAALWQAVVCFIFAPVLLLSVITLLSLPKKLAHRSRGVYLAASPLLSLSQFLLPWLGWSALIAWMNRGTATITEAVWAGGAVALLSYAAGFLFLLRLRPRAEDVVLTKLEVTIAGWPRAFDGYTILHLTDAHGGVRPVRASINARLQAARAVAPDLVVFTGDLASRATAVEETARELGSLTGRDGRYAVLGNHDHWIGEERVTRALTQAGFRVLGNEHVRLEREGQVCYLAGVKDATYTRHDDLPAALAGLAAGVPVIAITHSPDLALRPGATQATLILCGHTHGGQVIFPWIGPLYVPTKLGRRRMQGLFLVEGVRVFISRGLGEVWPPFRLNCPPEIAVLTLRSI